MSDEMNIEILVNTHNANGEVKKLEQQISELKGAVSKASQGKGLEIKVDNSVKSIAEVIKMVDKLQGELEEVNRKYAKNQNNAANKQAAAEIREKTKAEKEYLSYLRQERTLQEKMNRRDDKIDNRSFQYDSRPQIPQYVSYNQQLHALNEEAQKFHQQMRKGIVTNGDYQRSLSGINMQAAAIRKEMKEMPMLLNQSGTYLGSFAQKFRSHLNWIVAGSAIAGMVAVPIEILKTIKEIETAMAGMNQVIDHRKLDSEAAALGIDKHKYAQEQLNKETEVFIDIAAMYGEKTTDIIEAGKLWGRMYKDLSIVNVLTGQSAKLAVADNFSLVEANKALEAAMFQYGLTAKNSAEAVAYSGRIIDVWTKLAHTAGASAQDLTQAVERTGSVAKMVGVDFEFLNAIIATGVRATGRSGAELGNTLKTVFGSIHSSKAIEEIGKLGVSMYQTGENGQQEFRKVQDVLMDLMVATQGTKANLEDMFKAASGGKFQWAKASAMFGDYKEFIHAWGEAVSSQGFTSEQIGMQLDTISRKMATLKADLDGLFSNVGNAGLATWAKEMLDSMDRFVLTLRKIPAIGWQTVGFITEYGIKLVILKSAIVACRNAVASYRLAQAGSAVATVAETAATTASTVAKGIGTVATNSATVATSRLAVATTIATGGLNLILPLVIAAGTAFYYYADSTGAAEKAARESAQATEDDIAIRNQEIETAKQQIEFTDALIAAHKKIKEQISTTSEGTEKYEQVQKNLEETEEQLTLVLGEAAVERIRQSGWTQDAYNKEKEVYKQKVEEQQIALQNLVNSEIKAANATAETIRQNIVNYYEDAEHFGESIGKKLKYLSIWQAAMLTGYEMYTGWNESREKIATNRMEQAQNAMALYSGDDSEDGKASYENALSEYEQAQKDLASSKNEAEWSRNKGKEIINEPLAEMKEHLRDNNKKKIDLLTGNANYHPTGAGGSETSEIEDKSKGSGSSLAPSDTKSKLEKNEWKMRKDDAFTKAKLSADRYTESLNKLELLEALYGQTAGSTILKQTMMKDRTSELAKENKVTLPRLNRHNKRTISKEFVG